MSTEAVLSQDAQVDKGESSRMTSFVGAIAISDLVKTTLGPKGMDKILQSVGSKDKAITITNDGATILKALPVENPAAKILIDIAKTQDEEIGDGTTTVTVLCGELLRTAEELINRRIHPQTIIQGWRIARMAARGALESLAMNRSENDAEFRHELFEVARTTLCSKLVNVEKDHFANLAVDAVLRLAGSNNIDHIQIIKKPGGNLRDSCLVDGFVIDKSPGIGQPKRIENAKILVANTPMDTDKIKIYGSRVRVEGFDKIAEIEQAERDKMRNKCNNIINHGINVFINRQLIYDFPDSIFCEAGVMAIEHADFDGIERLAAVTGADITSTFDHPESCQLGRCALIDEVLIGEDVLMRFSGCASGTACSIILRGASSHLLDEAERSLHDALAVLLSILAKDKRQIPGGGCGEMTMACAVDRVLPTVSGKASFAVEGFARALRQLPYILADNAGLDASQLVADLRQAHASHSDPTTSCVLGVDTSLGQVADMIALGVRESFVSKLQILISASEGAEMILRVDQTIKCPPRKRDR